MAQDFGLWGLGLWTPRRAHQRVEWPERAFYKEYTLRTNPDTRAPALQIHLIFKTHLTAVDLITKANACKG